MREEFALSIDLYAFVIVLNCEAYFLKGIVRGKQ